jgi:hypothetical protein
MQAKRRIEPFQSGFLSCVAKGATWDRVGEWSFTCNHSECGKVVHSKQGMQLTARSGLLRSH